MTLTRSRPPFILAIIADSQGCGLHRGMMPLASLVESGAVDGRIDMMVWPDHVVAAAKPDVVVWQRQVEDSQIEAMARWRAILPDATFIYELDDYLGEIPAASFHASFMPPDIEARVARALAHCDRVTTTTAPLAEWLTRLGGRDVRVVPNALPQARLKERAPRTSGKLRIGFAGGISHAGDLALIKPAMDAIGDKVTWVFMGMVPEGLDPEFPVEFHEGVAATSYLDKMATLDLDLMLAPLEDNPFNRCKSNLRLVEAGAIGAAVIAQDMTPYHTDKPPVFAYATTPDEWTAAIKRFVAAKTSEREHAANALRAWVGRHYTLERVMPKRLAAWTPAGNPWKPALPRERTDSLVVSCPDTDLAERMPFLRKARLQTGGLVQACVHAVQRGADVLWLRPATTMGAPTWDAITAAAVPTVASVVALASDGVNAFPATDQWVPMPPTASLLMADVVGELMEGRQLSVRAPSGPAVLLTAAALSMLGAPDVEGCDGNEEQAILEWGLRATTRQWKHMQVADGFASSLAPPAQPTQQAVLRLQARGFAQQLQTPSESLTAVEREAMELRMLRLQWGGPRPGAMGFDNDYESWAALRDVQSPTPVSGQDSASRVLIRDFDCAPDWSSNDWVVFVTDAVVLRPHATQALSDAIALVPASVDVVYADHEGLAGGKVFPEFKPDFDRELFFAQDYITPICAIRGSEIATAPLDRSDLYARLADIAVQPGAFSRFSHVARVLGTMKHQDAPEHMALEALSRQVALQDLLGERASVTPCKQILGCLTVVHKWQATWPVAPKVSIVVPTLGSGRLIQPCVSTILQHTAYPNYEIVVVHNGTRPDPELSPAVRKDPRVKAVRWDGVAFNWSSINNEAIRDAATGEFIVTMNDDVNVATKGWLDAMMGQAQYADVGVVGARLLHPAGFVQHVGVVCHRGVAGHMHKMLPNGQAGHLGRAVLSHEASAVTGACMLFSREHFDAVGGFNEDLSHNYNDTDFCLRVGAMGLRIVVEMTAELLHPEGTSRESAATPEGARKLIEEGQVIGRLCPGDDPYWNVNMALGAVNGGLGVQGLNADMLAWSDFVAQADAERVLIVNDLPGIKGRALSVLRHGGVPIGADLSGFHICLSAPNAMCVRPWDVRDVKRMRQDFAALGITRIVLRSLVGREGAAPPVETLRCLGLTGLPVQIDAVDFATMTPWLADDPEDSPFGGADMSAWRQAYEQITATQQIAAE